MNKKNYIHKPYKIKGWEGPISAFEMYYILLLFLLSISFVWLQILTDIGTLSPLFKIISACTDSLLILFPFLFLRTIDRLLLPIVATVVILLIEANGIYYRNFADLIAPSLYFSNVSDPTITNGIFATLGWRDLIPLFSLLGVWFLWFWMKYRRIVSARVGRPFKAILIILTILFLTASFIGSYRRTRLNTDLTGFKEITEKMLFGETTDWQGVYTNRNFTGYLFTCLGKAGKQYHELTGGDLTFIKSTLYDAERSIATADSLKSERSKRNLIVIVVESLQSNLFDYPQLKEIAPTMTRLSADTANVFVKDCAVLAGAGKSSDGQFIINTGLLPLRGEALVTNYASGDYPGLAKAFPGESIEVIGERRSLWSHGVTTESYGYDRLISDIAAQEDNQDSLIFHRAIKEIDSLAPPFYLFVTTLSMHSPYLTSRVSSDVTEEFFRRIGITDKRDKEYLRRLNHFDSQLAYFLNALAEKGLYDDSYIVITGDHDVMPGDISAAMHCSEVPLFILNAGSLPYRKESVTQLDIFPSVVDLINPDYHYTRFNIPYSGLGNSIFRPGEPRPITEDDYRASELIIKSK